MGFGGSGLVPAGAGGTRAKLAQLPTQGRHRLPRLDFGPGWCPVPRKPGAQETVGMELAPGASGSGHAWR